jgi:hypothetical protein
MTTSVFTTPPDRTEQPDVTVMQQTTIDDLPHIQKLWPTFEELVGLRGRKMYALADERKNTYTTCTPIKDDDDPAAYGLETGILPGGWYLRGRIVGDPPGIFGLIGTGMQELKTLMPADGTRPLVEFYRRHNEVRLWMPITV